MIEREARDLELLSGWLSQTAEVERLAARFTALAHSVRPGVAVMTRSRLLFGSARLAELLDRDPATLPATPLATLFPDRESRARVREALRSAWSGNAAQAGPLPVARADGAIRLVSIGLQPLPREAEPALLVVIDEAAGGTRPPAGRPQGDDTLRAFGLYLAGLANDLRGPLTAFLGHLALLTKRTDLPPDLREAFELYHQVTAETLDRFGRAMEWGRRVPLVEHVDLRAVVEAAVATFETEASPGAASLTLDLSAVPPVAGNSAQLQLALEHVLRNAWEALEKTGGTIHVGLHARGRRISLVVADNGPGIPDSLLPHVFDAFSSTKSIASGLGLGLAIVKDIVARHQGEVTIDSSSAGTTVTFLFDAIDEAHRGRPSARPRVLLVEDNLAVQETERMLLERAGWDVVTAGDADQALVLLTREEVDALVVDVQMPGRDGLAFVEAIATWHPHVLPRVALHTAYAYEDRVRAVAERFGVALLEKPCPFDKLLTTVRRLAGLGD
jgi:signal transduction histidine kinase/CheY-like chemotaxis protein